MPFKMDLLSETMAANAKTEEAPWHKNYMQLKQLEKTLQKTIQIIEKSSNETEVEWLQFLAISNKLKGKTAVQSTSTVKMQSETIVLDDETVNATPLDIKYQPKYLQDVDEEEFDSD